MKGWPVDLEAWVVYTELVYGPGKWFRFHGIGITYHSTSDISSTRFLLEANPDPLWWS